MDLSWFADSPTIPAIMSRPRVRILTRSFAPTLLACLTALAGTTVACGGSDGSSEGDGNSSGGSSSGGNGGSGGGTAPDLDDLDPAAEAEWTIFVYGHGDHNLSNSLLADMAEMMYADLGKPGKVNVLVLADWDASQRTSTGERFPSGVELYRIPGGGELPELVATGPELNLDDPRILTSVVGDVFEAFPARRRGVVLWDHGGGWSGGFGSDTQNGTDLRPTPMPAEAIAPALAKGLAAAGVEAEPPLDLFAFDTCLMAGAEVAYPFRDLTKVYIANAEIDYGAGWDYTATLSYIANNLDASAIEIARAEVGHWDAHHGTATANDALLRSHVALDMSKLDAVADAAAEFTSALANSEDFDVVELGRAGFFASPPYWSKFESGSDTPGLRDAGQLFRALRQVDSDSNVADAAQAVEDALDALVLDRSQGSLREAARQIGVHIELSLASQITADKAEQYDERAAAWVKASGWPRVLDALTDGADAVAPTSEHEVINADGASLAYPPVLQFQSDAPDIAKAAVYAGEVDGDQVLLYGLVGSGIVEPDEAYQFEWGGAVALFPDGQPAMLDLWLDSGSDSLEPVLSVPVLLDGAAEQPLEANLVFSPSEEGASVAVVSLGSVGSTMSLAEIAELAPSATITPLYYVIDVNSAELSLVAGDPMPLPESGTYPFSIGYLDAGTYVLLNLLSDVWGNVGAEGDAVVLLEPLGQ